MLHGEEAVVPKRSAMGGILNMMQGGMGDMKAAMKSGDIGFIMDPRTALEPKLMHTQKKTQGAIPPKQIILLQILMGISQEVIDEAQEES